VLRSKECLSSLHHGDDLELSSVSQWVSWEVDSLRVGEPLHRSVVFAWVELQWDVLGVGCILSSEADAGMVDNLSSSEGDLLVWFVSPWSNIGILLWSMLVSKSVGNGHVSLLVPSDRVGS